MIQKTLVSMLTLSTFALAAGLVASACSSDDSSGAGVNGGAAGAAGSAGSDGSEACPGEQCAFKASPCLAIADNTGASKVDLRISQLVVTSPPSLTNLMIERDIINRNTRPPFDETTCAITGMGGFSWLFSFDGTTLTTGGGAPLKTQAGAQAGTCFMNLTDEASHTEVKPVQVAMTVADDGSFQSPVIDDIVVPIFLETSYVLLPLHKVSVKSVPGGGLTDDSGNGSKTGNCIGTYRKDLGAENDCRPSDSYTYFKNGAAVDGFISLEEADQVLVKDMGASLCVLLSGDATTYGETVDGLQRCKRDAGAIAFKGDWDSASNSAKAGGDSVQLKADFAAAAIKILGTGKELDCSDAQ